MKIAIVGGLTIDLFDYGRVIGGPPWYTGTAVASMGCDAAVYSAVGEDFPEEFFEFMREAGIDVGSIVKVMGNHTYVFQHIYVGGGRKSVLIKIGPKIPHTILEDMDAQAGLLSPVYKEVDETHLMLLRRNVERTALDVQGFLRETDVRGNIRLVCRDLSKVFSSSDVVHCSDEEALVLAGEDNVVDAVVKVGRKISGVLLVGSKNGIYLVENGVLCFLETSVCREVVDLTGVGDMLTGFFLVYWLGGLRTDEAAASALSRLMQALESPPPRRFIQTMPSRMVHVRKAWTRSL